MARKKFSCDFETTTKIDDCRVWAWGIMEIDNKKNTKIGNTIETFMQWMEKVKADIYFHNLKFDGCFIVNWLLSNGYEWCNSGREKTFHGIISKMGQWYMIDICYGYKGKRKLHTKIYDSLKKLPFSVKQIGKAFNLKVLKVEHGEEFYTRERSKNHIITEEEELYINNDIEVVADALSIQFSQGLVAMTNGSDSLNDFKDRIGGDKKFKKLFPVFTLEMNHGFRKAYKGGFTWLNDRFKELVIGDGMVFDVNSLYPSRMYYDLLPYGEPIFFEGKYQKNEKFPLHIQHMTCEFMLKENHIPTIQIKGDKTGLFKANEYVKSSKGEIVELWLTNVDLDLFFEHYDVYNVTYLEGWAFMGKVGIFKEFIDYWMDIKINSTGAIKQLAKLMLNSLYGKFATNPDVTGKIPYLKEGGELGFRLDDETFKEPVYTPMGAFITAYARDMTIRTAQKCYDRIIYCDTDSIHLTGTEIPEAISDLIDDDKLGFWAHESNFKRAKYLRQKTYVYEIYKKKIIKDGKEKEVNANKDDYEYVKLSVKCAGMPENVKKVVTFENFNVGLKVDGLKKKPKQVKGGVVLVNTPFEIKPNGGFIGWGA